MAQDLYDEFGNYIGPELSGSEQVREEHNILGPDLRLCSRITLGH